MSFSKAKLKRFNDVEACDSPSVAVIGTASTGTSGLLSSTAHLERKGQIEKFFKESVKANGTSTSTKELKDTKEKEKNSLKLKGLRLFRTPSLPHRLRFRQSSDLTTSLNTATTTPICSPSSTQLKEYQKSASNLKGKEALHFEIRTKNELLENYLSQIGVLKRHVDQLKETEIRLRDENTKVLQKKDTLITELTSENISCKSTIECLSLENSNLLAKSSNYETELKALTDSHCKEIAELKNINLDLKVKLERLTEHHEQQINENLNLSNKLEGMDLDIKSMKENLFKSEENYNQSIKELEQVQVENFQIRSEVIKLKDQIEKNALAYTVEMKNTFVELESLRNEKNALKNDLAIKSELIKNLQDEVIDKICEIDSHRDTIQILEDEKKKIRNFEQALENAEKKVRIVENQSEQEIKKLELKLEQAVELERKFWQLELNNRQQEAENQVIKIELEKQDVMVLLENTNDMLRERDEKIQKYEEQLRKGLDYYIQLTDTLQKQVVDIKADMAKTITEKYNYQLTLNNTRSTVNILMERLKKSDSDVECLKTELETAHRATSQIEQRYKQLQTELEAYKNDLSDSVKTLNALKESSTSLQNEVRDKETMLSAILTSEEETLEKFNKIANTFQERIDENVDKYIEMYLDLKNKDENRELYMTDMRKALDEFAAVLEFAQLEIDNKDKCLSKLRDENESLKLENFSLKSKIHENSKCIAEKDTEDTQLRAECDKITNWLLSESDENSDVKELLKEKINVTPKSLPRTPKKCQNTTPKTSRSPLTPKPLKTVFLTGKENIDQGVEIVRSPLKTRNQ